MSVYDSDDFEFTVKGSKCALHEMTIDEFTAVEALYEIKDPFAQMAAFRDALMGAGVDDLTKETIRGMGIKKVVLLFRDWSGLGSSNNDKGLESGEGSSSTV